MQSLPADTEPGSDLARPLECGAEAHTRVHKSVCLFGGLKGAPVPSMERYAEAMLEELPTLGWPARLVRGRIISLPGSRASRFVSTEFSRHVLYPRSARRERADVFHITDHSFAHLVHALPRERTVVTCHDLMPWMVPEIFSRRLGRAVGLPLWERSVRAMKDAAHVTCDSECTRRDVIERIGCREERTSVVPLAASDRFFQLPADARVRARYAFGMDEDVCAVLHVGHSQAYKNVEQVIRVVHALRDQGINAKLLKVGAFGETQMDLIAELGLSTHYLCFRGLSDESLCACYNAADVMLFPSKYEGYGLPPAEAMRAGLPVVVSNTPALVEVTAGLAPAFAHDDVDGMASAVRAIWERRDHRRADTAPARRLAETYTWRRTGVMLAAIYSRIAP